MRISMVSDVVKVPGSLFFTPKSIDMDNKALLIELRLKDDDQFTIMCLKKLYARQEEDEQDLNESLHRNDKGFNKADARLLGMYAREALAGNQFNESAIQHVQQLLPKYAKQLSHILKDEEVE